ncbi:MAG: ABC transporter permease [Anaerolineales bacterium]|nr:ABC transporter permease [Anaerolineales bacterium]
MKSLRNVIGLGLARGWTEFWIPILTWQGLLGALFAPVSLVAILWFFRERQSEGVSLALLMLPGFLSFQLAQEGLVGVAQKLALDREDGTLLRAKALPQGMLAYLIARVVVIVLSALMNLMLVLIPVLFIAPGLVTIDGTGFITLAWVFALAFLAITPIGAVIGAIMKSPAAALGLSLLPMGALVLASGIFYPLAALPVISEIFPVYWLGHGLRSALLPEMLATLEIGGSWRPLETALVLAAWATGGLLLAPGILRRMARRTSGSEMEAGRRRYTQSG